MISIRVTNEYFEQKLRCQISNDIPRYPNTYYHSDQYSFILRKEYKEWLNNHNIWYNIECIEYRIKSDKLSDRIAKRKNDK